MYSTVRRIEIDSTRYVLNNLTEWLHMLLYGPPVSHNYVHTILCTLIHRYVHGYSCILNCCRITAGRAAHMSELNKNTNTLLQRRTNVFLSTIKFDFWYIEARL